MVVKALAEDTEPLCRFAPPQFFAPKKTLRVFPHRAQKNVSYRRNIRRHFYG